MTGGPTEINADRQRRGVVAAMGTVVVLVAALGFWLQHDEGAVAGPTVGEKIIALRAERASLQAKADGEARMVLLAAFRTAGLLGDALAARHEPDRERAFDRLPEQRREAFAELDTLNAALRVAVERPGEGARLAVDEVADLARVHLEHMAGLDSAPLLLTYTPAIVPPRRHSGEIALTPGAPAAVPPPGPLRIEPAQDPPAAGGPLPTVPRYAPGFAAPEGDDPALQIEITGLNVASTGGRPPVLSVGTWRGEATAESERLHFSVPRSAFATDAVRTRFATGSLSLRHGSRTVTFQLLFLVLPDRPGSFAFDQKIGATTFESNTLVSPEILARAPAGETRTVRRCFDPPPGWRFDKARRRIVVVERLGWIDDAADETLNGGTVEFVREDAPGQICLAVVARPVTQAARTATIGRFEATLVRDVPVERAVQSGIRALDWREAARLPIESEMLEWKLYVRLFGEVDREFGGTADSAIAADVPFLHITTEDDGKTVVLRADPTVER